MNIGLSVLENLNTFFDDKVKQINAPDIFVLWGSDTLAADNSLQEKVKKLDSVKSAEVTECLLPTETMFMNGNKEVTTRTVVFSTDVKQTMAPLKISNLISAKNSVYLPYQFSINYGYAPGEHITFTMNGHEYEYTIAGFYEDVLTGNSNMGLNKIYVTPDAFDALKKDSVLKTESISLMLNNKENTNDIQLDIQKLLQSYPLKDVVVYMYTETSAKEIGMLLTNIIAIMLLAFASVIVIVSLIAIEFVTSNVIRESIRSIGILKASGYRTIVIRNCFIIQYMILVVISGVVGSVVSYMLMPLAGSIISQTIGLKWNNSISLITCLISVMIILLLTVLMVFISTKNVRKISALDALRQVSSKRNNRRDFFRIYKSRCNINLAISIKSIFSDLKQSIIIVAIAALLTFACTISVILFYNLAINNSIMVNLLGIPNAACRVVVSENTEKEVNDIADKLKEKRNIESIAEYSIIGSIKFENKSKVHINVSDDFALLRMDTIFNGVFPDKDDKVSISVDLAEKYHKSIGDKIEIALPWPDSPKIEYTITGITQVLGGTACEMTYEGAKRLIGSCPVKYIYIYPKSNTNVDNLISDLKKEYKYNKIDTIADIIQSNLKSYTAAASVLAVVIVVLTIVTVIIILYLLIKIRLFKERHVFGMYKTMGYTTGQLIFQLSFCMVLLILIGVIIGATIGICSSGALILALFKMFGGLKNAALVIMPSIICLVALMIVLVALLTSYILAHSLKRISVYELITE